MRQAQDAQLRKQAAFEARAAGKVETSDPADIPLLAEAIAHFVTTKTQSHDSAKYVARVESDRRF